MADNFIWLSVDCSGFHIAKSLTKAAHAGLAQHCASSYDVGISPIEGVKPFLGQRLEKTIVHVRKMAMLCSSQRGAATLETRLK